MMGRLGATIGLMALIHGGALLQATEPAIAGDRGPVCREPSLVDEITPQVRDQDYYGEVDARLVTETTTSQPNTVRCQVCVLSAPYAMTPLGDRPIKQCLRHDFEIRILSGGFVVRDLE
jgi:hypothetical protein